MPAGCVCWNSAIPQLDRIRAEKGRGDCQQYLQIRTRNNPRQVLFYLKIRIFVASCTETHGGHIGESVFALSFPRNLTVSTNVRTTTAPSPVLVVYSSQTIQVWGLFQSVYVRALSEPLGRQTDRLHTFFLYKPADTGVSLHIKLILNNEKIGLVDKK